jgi:hypothetical protein
VDQPIVIGVNNIGIAPGTKAAIASVPSATAFTFSSAVSGSGNQGYVAADNFVDTGYGDEIAVVRKFGSMGVQIHRVADVRGVIYLGYDEYPKPAISPHGRYVVWATNNGIPGYHYTLIAEVGLGSPQRSEQFTGPADGVTVVPAQTTLQFNLLVRMTELHSEDGATAGSGGSGGADFDGAGAGRVEIHNSDRVDRGGGVLVACAVRCACSGGGGQHTAVVFGRAAALIKRRPA